MSRRNLRSTKGRVAFTLIELLVAMSISLVMLFAVIRFLEYVGDTVSDGRAMIELTSQLRAVRQRLHEDLSSLTVPVRAYADNGGAQGYFMIYESPASDQDRDGDGVIEADANTDGSPDTTPIALATSPWGDYGDMLAFTIHSRGEPFTGRTPVGMKTAENAEVIWYCGWDDADGQNDVDIGEMRYLFRRQLLIDPNLVIGNGNNGALLNTDVSPDSSRTPDPVTYPFTSMQDAVKGLKYFQQNYDLSVHIEPRYNSMSGAVQNWVLVGNTLADLARRENRFGNYHGWGSATGMDRPAYGFPNAVELNSYNNLAPTPANPGALGWYILQGNRLGEDVQLSRMIAFDVRVFDPLAMVVQQTYTNADIDAAGPSDRLIDPMTSPGTNAAVAGYGAFVDLYYSRYANAGSGTFFSGPSSLGSQLSTSSNFSAIYDTWSVTYERDGINQDGDTLTDEGTNGIDDGFSSSVDPTKAANYPIAHSNTSSGNIHYNGADDPSEKETIAPYETPLRGVQVIIRVYDPSTRQLRQATVVADFTPE